MPKIVDPEARRADIVNAVWRIAQRDGLEQASLRNIATEAGLAIGSVRHYFADHSEVMSTAMETLVDQFSERILKRAEAAKDPRIDRRVAVESLLEEFLPLDQQRHAEASAWLSFSNAARTWEQLAPFSRKMHEGTRTIIGRVLNRIAESGRVAENFDVHIETERLAAVIDGLTLGAVLHPDLLDNETARATLRRHLDSLLVR